MIVPTFTYIASVNTIIQTGATPVFVDSLEATWKIDPEDVRRKITEKTKAVMAVHLDGLPCEMNALTSICKEHGLQLIEDCAEAFGTLYRGQHVGTFGDVATFSFFGNKTITTGEGGMVVAKDKSVLEKAFHLKNQGVSQTREYWHDMVAYDYPMTNICAAIGWFNWKKQMRFWPGSGRSRVGMGWSEWPATEDTRRDARDGQLLLDVLDCSQ